MRWETEERPGWIWAVWVVLIPIACTMVFRMLVPDRSDYSGHFLAGFAASLGFIWFAARLLDGRPSATAAASGLCVLFGLILEATVFPLGGFDALDFFSQSAGAVLAGLALLETGAGDPEADSPDGISPLVRNGHGRLVLAASAAGLIAGAFLAFA